MSRVHDALRRAESSGGPSQSTGGSQPAATYPAATLAVPSEAATMQALLDQVEEIPWDPAPEAHMIDHERQVLHPSIIAPTGRPTTPAGLNQRATISA